MGGKTKENKNGLLIKNMEEYRTIFENLPFLAFTFDRKGRILDSNNYIKKITGLRLKDVRGKSFFELGILGKMDLLKSIMEFRKNLQGKVTGKTVYKAKMKNGREIFFEVIGIPLKEKGKVTKILIVGNDITEREKAMKDITESEEKFRTIFETANDIIMYVDKYGKILNINEKVEDILGYKRNDVVGKNFARTGALTVKEAARLAKLLLEAVRKRDVLGSGPMNMMEVNLKHKNGKMVSLESSTQIIKKNGKVEGFLNILRDITERKKAEEVLKENEERFHTLFKKMPDAAIVLDRKGTLLETSEEAERLTGYKKEELLGKNIFRTNILDTKNKVIGIGKLALTFAGAKIHHFEIEIKRKDGKKVPLEISSQIINFMGRKADMVILRDMTERKKAGEELRSSEERLRILFEYAPDAIYINDLKGNFIDGNKASEKMIGYRKSELIGKNIAKAGLLPKSQIPKALVNLAKNAMGNPTGPDSFTLIRKDDRKVEVEISTYPVKIKGRTVVLSIAHDITERKKTEDELIKSKKELEKKVYDLERFSKAGVGRELRMVELKKRNNELEDLLVKHGIEAGNEKT